MFQNSVTCIAGGRMQVSYLYDTIYLLDDVVLGRGRSRSFHSFILQPRPSPDATAFEAQCSPGRSCTWFRASSSPEVMPLGVQLCLEESFQPGIYVSSTFLTGSNTRTIVRQSTSPCSCGENNELRMLASCANRPSIAAPSTTAALALAGSTTGMLQQFASKLINAAFFACEPDM